MMISRFENRRYENDLTTLADVCIGYITKILLILETKFVIIRKKKNAARKQTQLFLLFYVINIKMSKSYGRQNHQNVLK